jgi:uncharacterized glyoxalase superfamily protein PhnB
MTVTSLFPILSTPDLPRLLGFYERALGASVTYRFEDGGRDVYVALGIGGGAMGIGEDTKIPAASSDDRIVLWFYVDDVDAAFAAAREAGAVSDQEPTDMPWGERVARVRDLDGNLLNLGAAAG